MTPALRALRAHWPQAEIHVLVAAEAAPLLEGLPLIDRLWPLPRSRGQARVSESLPLIKSLRAERFDRSVDFVGNDRGALLSRLIGADIRLGVRPQSGNRHRRLCYTHTIEELDTTRHETVRDYYVLSPWGVPPPASWELEVAPPPTAPDAPALSPGTVLAHLSTSQRKKEWPIAYWNALGRALAEAGRPLCFSSGPSAREQALLQDLKSAWPQAPILPRASSLSAYIATVAQARLFVSPDTAPLHIAAGLGVPTLGLFGPTSAARWAPPGPNHRTLHGNHCPCSGHLEQCQLSERCIDTIPPATVFAAIQQMLS